MVEVAPPSSMDRMLSPLPRGSFHVQLGVLWPLLPVGRHRVRNLPLTPLYSNIATWLQARDGPHVSVDVARDCLKHEGLAWLSMLADPKSALVFLEKSDLEIYSLSPMTRNIGSRPSARRLLLLSFFAHLCNNNDQAADYLNEAGQAIEHNLNPNLQPNYRSWYHQLRSIIWT